MNVLDCIYKRRSIRKYSQKPVDDETLITLVKAATAAPTACNTQPWEFIIVTDDEVRKELKSKLYFGNYDAPAAIVVCGNMKLAMSGPVKDFWIQDCSAAIENILLAATSMGLGTLWIGLHPVESNYRPLYKIFDLPKEVIPLAVIFVGYPEEEKEPRTQFNEKRIYWNKYEPRKHRARKKNTKKL
ncbi:nitroreductase family protein [Oceanirhabdus sp. W0125-5]|uniref:nitroreductase family protein n=1 Tax=Oceanirhabdus sp. W0125-5 TaxID=2999116 RepID=UPI0022F2ADF3|nr:nitroreductase family protein [Oceanirhabdus sp. W0125-5]WBW96943.1 nitroreductase family protein [Oceanirhabdus sp. W0125-5]